VVVGQATRPAAEPKQFLNSDARTHYKKRSVRLETGRGTLDREPVSFELF
jgi:hypothetical protein